MSKFLVLTCFFLCINCQLLAQEVGFPFIRNYSPKEYDNTPQIFAITQDAQGLLYFGTADGDVIEYDGKKWTRIDIPNKSTIYGLAIDKKGVLYVGAANNFGYLKTTPLGKKEFVSVKPLMQDTTLKLSPIWQVEAFEDKVYFVSSTAFFEYSDLPTPTLKTYIAHEGNRFTGLFAHQKNVYVREANVGLLKLEKDSLHLVTDFYKDKGFKTILPFTKDTLLFVSRTQGLYKYNPITTATTNFTLSPVPFFEENNLYSGAILPRQTLALGSMGKGLLVVSKEGKPLQYVDETTLLSSNTIYHVHKTPTNSLWLGLGNGISRSEGVTAWSYWSAASGVKGEVTDVLRFDGKLYITTTMAVYCIENKKVQEVKGIPVGICWDLLEYTTPENTKILLVSVLDGVYEIKKTQATLVQKGEQVIRLEVSRKDPRRIFVAQSTLFNSFYYEQGKWKDEGKWEQVDAKIRKIVEDKNGELWLGTSDEGIVHVVPNYSAITKPQKVVTYTEKDGLPSLRIYPHLLKDKLVFGTNKGLYSHNSTTNRFELFCELDAKLCMLDIYSISETNDGKIWILPSKNKKQDIGYFQPTTNGKYEWVYKPFRLLPQMEMDCFYKDSTGIVWIAGSEGLFRYDEAQDTKNYDADFYTLIRKVSTINDSILYYGGTQGTQLGLQEKLDYAYNDLKLEFAAPFYDDETKTLYSYQLEGFDDTWSNWSVEGVATYTNLREGSYTFKVKAKNMYDKESQLSSYTLTILPPWYRTWWAYGLYSLLAGLAIFGIVKWNMRRLIQDKQHLEELVKQRTIEIAKQNQEIKQQNDAIQSKNAALQQQQEEILTQNEELHQQAEEITAQRDFIAHTNKALEEQYLQIHKSVEAAKLIQDAIIPFRERVSAFLPHYFAFYRPKDVVSGDFYWIEQVQDKIFIAVVDCTGHGVPGAFMSMIGNTLLDHIIKVQQLFSPEKVLEALNEEVHNSLKQSITDTENNNGMDLSFVCIEKREDDFLLSFAGAKRPLYYISSATNELSICKGSKVSIGGKHSFNKVFTKNEIELPYNSTFYLFSDGYADQCNIQRDAYGSLRLGQLLTEVAQMPIQLQEMALAKVFDDYKGGADQRDDILVVGVKIEK